MSNQIGFTIDVNQCISCRSCEMACKVEYDLQKGEGRRRQVLERTEDDGGGKIRTFFMSLACNHCENPACVAACPEATRDGNPPGWPANEKALYKDTAGTYSGGLPGVVRLNSDKCIACRRCEWACPYGAPQFNPNGGGSGIAKVHKCEMCWQRIEAWAVDHCTGGVFVESEWVNPITDEAISDKRRQPACSATCLGRAINATMVNTDGASETYGVGGSRVYKDYEDYVNNGDNPCVAGPSGNRDRGARTFVAAGDAGRGSGQIASNNQTNPAVKICNRVYKKREGGVE